jgi:hypothetical protein
MPNEKSHEKLGAYKKLRLEQGGKNGTFGPKKPEVDLQK